MEKSVQDSGLATLPLMEEFYTIQGEGFHQGRAAYFIRLAGCDVGCHWCDVKESWDASKYPQVSIGEIANNAAKSGAEIAVVTGGEPLMYNLATLTHALHTAGLATHIETSGAYDLTGDWDWVCFSPKKFKGPMAGIAREADELKVVVVNKSDFDWAESFAAEMQDSSKLYLQPEWDRSKKVLPLIIDYVKQNPKWEVSLQMHKYMNIP